MLAKRLYNIVIRDFELLDNGDSVHRQETYFTSDANNAQYLKVINDPVKISHDYNFYYFSA